MNYCLQMGRIVLVAGLMVVVVSGTGWPQGVQQTVDGFNLEGFSGEGEPAWNVRGSTADVLGDTIKIRDVDANAYGEQDVNITADHGEYDKTSGNVRLNTNVVVTTQEGGQLKTDELNWDKTNNVVTSDKEAVITDKGMVATGSGLIAHPDLKTAQLNKDVTVEMETNSRPQDPTTMKITCVGPMEFDQLNNIATFRDQVVAVRADQTLRADKVEVNFDPGTKKVATIICTDNVSVTRGQNTTYSDKAIYSAADQKIIFVGRPRLIMQGDVPEEVLSLGQ